MKIGIYNEPAGASIGGTEYTAAVLAEALAKQEEVEIVHHRPLLTSSLLAEIFQLDLSGVRTRYVAYDGANQLDAHGHWIRYKKLKAWHAQLSNPYDIFINFTHGLPPFCHARYGVLVVLFPMFDPFNVWPWFDDAPESTSQLRRRLRITYNDWEWQKRFRSYRGIVAISEFAKRWTKKRWQVDSEVIFPPVNTQFQSKEKRNYILSVGRFSGSGVMKNQLEMATAFRQMVQEGLCGWQFFCVGALSDQAQDKSYFEQVSQTLPSDQSQLLVNLERSKLMELFEGAKIFWHATGFGMDEDSRPEMMEHFGIVTVEAMAAGCVPVVINSGGQAEIVEHGVSGFLWNNMNELVDYTLRLMKDDALRAHMSAAARARSQTFDRSHFVDRFQKLLKPVLA